MEKLADISAFEGLSDQNGMMIHNVVGAGGFGGLDYNGSVYDYLQDAADMVTKRLFIDFEEESPNAEVASEKVRSYIKSNKQTILDDFYTCLMGNTFV